MHLAPPGLCTIQHQYCAEKRTRRVRAPLGLYMTPLLTVHEKAFTAGLRRRNHGDHIANWLLQHTLHYAPPYYSPYNNTALALPQVSI